MGKLIMWNVVTIDGCFEGEKPWDLGFHDLVWGKELEDFSDRQLTPADMLVFGRNTYQGMADYWSKATGKTADAMNAMRKVACSTTLENAGWNNTAIVRDAVSEISKLRRQENGNLFVLGSGILSESLMNAGLFDEIRLCVAPVILGKGRRLFSDGNLERKFRLLETRPLNSGGIIIRYEALR